MRRARTIPGCVREAGNGARGVAGARARVRSARGRRAVERPGVAAPRADSRDFSPPDASLAIARVTYYYISRVSWTRGYNKKPKTKNVPRDASDATVARLGLRRRAHSASNSARNPPARRRFDDRILGVVSNPKSGVCAPLPLPPPPRPALVGSRVPCAVPRPARDANASNALASDASSPCPLDARTKPRPRRPSSSAGVHAARTTTERARVRANDALANAPRIISPRSRVARAVGRAAASVVTLKRTVRIARVVAALVARACDAGGASRAGVFKRSLHFLARKFVESGLREGGLGANDALARVRCCIFNTRLRLRGRVDGGERRVFCPWVWILRWTMTWRG